MAPLRSSRTTRNQDHAAAARSRTGVLDLDPTDGLPVTKWSQISIRVNQDTDFSSLNSTNTGSADWSAQFNTPQFPWPEPPLPTYFKDLPLWNQEMIRRARAGNTENKLSVWDRKKNEWISAAEAEKKTTEQTLESNDQDQTTAANGQNGAHSSPKSNHGDDDSDTKSDDEHVQEEEATPFKTPTQTTKRRKTAGHLEPRVFEVKKWVQVPMSIAEKTAEPKFLADRRPGMPALYNPTYQNAIFGSYLSSNQVAMANYDLGDGGGLGNAGEMLGTAPTAEPEAPPVRRNMPPKRKKKKIGGPGRKKANVAVGADGVIQASGEAGTLTGDGQSSNTIGTAEGAIGGDTVMEDVDGDEASSSEGEGSEEGEIEEGTGGEKKTEDNSAQAATQEASHKESPPLSPLPLPPPEIAFSAPELEPEPTTLSAPEVVSEPVPIPVVESLPESVPEIEQIPIVASTTVEQSVIPEIPVAEPHAVLEPATVSDPPPEELMPQPPAPVVVSEVEVLSKIPALGPAPETTVAAPVEEPLQTPAREQEEIQGAHEVDLLGNLDASVDQDMAEK